MWKRRVRTDDGSHPSSVPWSLVGEKGRCDMVENSSTGHGPSYAQCLRAVRSSRKTLGDDRSVLAFVPQEYLTEELCEIAVSRNGEALRDVPDTMRTAALCGVAVREYGPALEYVPMQHRTKELCYAAVAEFGMALAFVPSEQLDEELVRCAVATAPMAVQFAPRHLMTEELWVFILGRHPGNARNYIPEDIEDRVIRLG